MATIAGPGKHATSESSNSPGAKEKSDNKNGVDNGREVDRADPMEPDDRDEDAPTDDEDTTTAEDDNDNELVGDEIANEDDDYRRRKSDNAAPKVQSRLQDEPTRDARPAETVDVRVETVAAG